MGTAVLKSEESRYADDQLLTRNTFTYDTSGAEFGRVTKQVETEYPSGSGGASYTATHAFSFSVDSVDKDALVQTHTLMTHDQLTVTRSQTRSRFTGRLRSATDAQGTVTQSTYDNLGRLLTRTVNPGTANAATETHTYAAGPGGKGFTVTSTDARGNQVRHTLDGASRLVKTEHLDIDDTDTSPRPWYPLKTIAYDDQGRVASTKAQDHTREGTNPEVSQTFTYDDWGELLTADRSTGGTHLTQTDPVRQTVTTQLLHGSTEVTGTEVTTLDTRRRPVSVERFDLKHTSRGTRTITRDGWGRVRRTTGVPASAKDPVPTTTYDYDTHGRPTLTTLPDGTRISRTYAPFSSARLATGVTVIAPGAQPGDTKAYGTQTFDGLGRLTSTTSGGRTWSYTYATDADLYADKATAPDGQVIAYRYARELGNALTQVKGGDITQTFTRDPVTGVLTKAQEGDTTRTRDYLPSGLVSADTTEFDKTSYTTKATYTVAGLEDSYTAVDKAVQKTTRDTFGRIYALVDADPSEVMQATVDYDNVGRVGGWTATDVAGHKLTTTLDLDDFGRESKRTVTDDTKTSWILAQEWNDNDTLKHRILERRTPSGTTKLREETFAYDIRNRLTAYQYAGTTPPKDARGNTVTAQTFEYDAYSNITTYTTTFPRGKGSDTATYHYLATDPCQLTSVEHTHADYPASTTLSYDKAGRLTTDDAGHALTYDALGRLSSAGTMSTYHYDPLDRLLAQKTKTATSVLSYRNGTLTALTEGGTATRLLQLGWTCAAQHRSNDQKSDTRLLGTATQSSVLLTTDGTNNEEHAYTPYGDRSPEASTAVLGYTGERTDPDTGWLHLGNGYRPYHPGLMRFTAPDSLSPFGAGGINPYTYCAGDPINHTDPTGHLSWGAWLSIGIGIVGLAAAVFTGGASIVAAGGLIAALETASAAALVVGALAVASDVTAITSGALEEASPNASSILGWVSLGTGLAALGTGLAAAAARGLPRLATRSAQAARAGEAAAAEGGGASLARFYAQLGENTFGADEAQLAAGNTAREAASGAPVENSLQGAVGGQAADAVDAADAPRRIMYHYTTPEGEQGIRATRRLEPSHPYWGRGNHAHAGSGQYLTDRPPSSFRSLADRSRTFVNNSRDTYRFSRHLAIDVTDQFVHRPWPDRRPNVFVIHNYYPLDLTGRILDP